MKTWTVYRDGYAYTVLAPDLLTAVDRAQPWALKGPSMGQRAEAEEKGTPLRVASTRKAVTGSPWPGQLDIDFGDFRPDVWPVYVCQLTGRDVLEVRRDGNTVAVRGLEKVPRLAVLGALLRRLWGWHAARDAPRALAHVERYKSGKRKGEPRWSKEHGPVYRSQVCAALANNAELDRQGGEALDACEALCGVLASERTEAPTFGSKAALGGYSEMLADAGRLARWPLKIDAHLASLRALCEQERAVFTSIEDYGFGPGTVCNLKPSNFPEPGDPVGRVTILRAYVETEGRAHVHCRDFDHEGKEWGGLPVHCFEKL